MKRLISLLLTCTMLLTLCACGHTENIAPTTTPDEIPTPIVDSTEVPDNTEQSTDTTPSDTEAEDTAQEESAESDEPVLPEEPEEFVRTIDPYGKMVALTFDDGPHETFSHLILDVLEEYNSVATFFEVGRNARAYPDVLTRMAELGCEVASHSNVHHDLTTLSRNALLTDLGYADTAIENATGTAPVLVRPPYGAVNKTVKYETGRAMITWTVDPQDWRLRDAQKLVEYFQSFPSLDGEVVLLHSIHGSTAEAMKTIIPWLIEQGYQLVTVSELLAYYYGVLMEPNVFYDQNWFLRHERTEYPLELPEEPMQTLIPEYTIVPVVPITPTETPETPPETPETPADGETPSDDTPTEPEAPSDTETPPEDTGEPEPPSDTAPPDTSADDTSAGTGGSAEESADASPDSGQTESTEPDLPPESPSDPENTGDPVPPGSEG